MKNYVVTGATSMLGSELVNHLSKNSKVFAIVRKKTTKITNIALNDNIILLYYDMSDYNKIELNEKKIDGVFHFSWEGARNPYRDDRNIQEKNYKDSIDLYNNLKKYKPDFFFGIGSQGEYGTYQIAYTEDLECKPTTQYGLFKNKFQIFLKNQCLTDNIVFLWGRVFSAYGSKDYPNTLIMSSIRKMLKNEDVDLSPCEHIWSFTYCKDVIKSIMLLITNHCSGIYNLTNNDNIMLKEYIIELKHILKSRSNLNFGAYKYNGYVPNMIADNSKLIRDTGYRPDYSFNDGIKELLEEI